MIKYAINKTNLIVIILTQYIGKIVKLSDKRPNITKEKVLLNRPCTYEIPQNKERSNLPIKVWR